MSSARPVYGKSTEPPEKRELPESLLIDHSESIFLEVSPVYVMQHEPVPPVAVIGVK